MKKKFLIISCPFVLLIGVVAQTSGGPEPKPAGNIVIYVSEKGEGLVATHNPTNQTVLVIFPDRRTFTFRQAVSASGVRYTNETSEFWEHQGEATFSGGDNIVYSGKTVN